MTYESAIQSKWPSRLIQMPILRQGLGKESPFCRESLDSCTMGLSHSHVKLDSAAEGSPQPGWESHHRHNQATVSWTTPKVANLKTSRATRMQAKFKEILPPRGIALCGLAPHG